MNKKHLFLPFFLLCFLFSNASADKNDDLPEPIKAALAQGSAKSFGFKVSPLPDQETLVYKAKFFGLSTAKFIITNNGKTTYNGREAYCFELKTKMFPFLAKLYKAKDRYVSYMDAQEFVTLRHEEYVKGGDVLESAVDFDYETHTATYTNFLRPHKIIMKIPDKLLDVLSGGFYLRMMALELGNTVDLNIYADEKIYNYIGLLAERTRVHVKHRGKQDAYYFLPYLFHEGKRVKKITGEVYFSTETPMKALRATLRTRLGRVYVVLVEGYEPEVEPDHAFSEQ